MLMLLLLCWWSPPIALFIRGVIDVVADVAVLIVFDVVDPVSILDVKIVNAVVVAVFDHIRTK